MVRRVGRMFYCRLRDSGVIASLWRPPVERIRLLTEKGQIVKYVYRRRTVACYCPGDGRFECVKPYDLVLWHKLKDRGKGAESKRYHVPLLQ